MSQPADDTVRHGMAVLYGLAGLAALILAGGLFVTGASGIAAMLLMIPNRQDRIARSRGILLLAVYTGFVFATLAAGRSHPI